MSDHSDLDFTIVGGKLVKPTQPSTDAQEEKPSEMPAEVPTIEVTPETPVASPELTVALGGMTSSEVEQLAEVSHNVAASEPPSASNDEMESEEETTVTYRDDFVTALHIAHNLRRVSAQGLINYLDLKAEDHSVAYDLLQDLEKFGAIRKVPGTDDLYMTIISTILEIEEAQRRFDAEMAATEEEELAEDAPTEPAPSVTVRTSPVTPLVTPVTPVTPPAATATPPVTAVPVAPTVPRGTMSRNRLFSILGAVLAVILLNITVIITRPQNAGFLPIFDIMVAALILAVIKPGLYSRSFRWFLSQARGGRQGKMIAGGVALGLLILMFFAVSQLSCDKHQGGAKYGKIDTHTKGSGVTRSSAKSDSAKIASATDSIATLRMNTEAFTAALRVLEQPSDYRMATDADEDDQYNVPPRVWSRIMEEAHGAGKKWDYGGNFYPAARDTVMQWWVRTQFLNGETVETLAPRWINRIKGLDVPPDTARVYGYKLIQEYNAQVKAMKDDGTLDSYRRSAKNILIPNPTKEEKKQQSKATVSRVAILLAGLIAILLLLSSLFHGKKLTKSAGILAGILGAGSFGLLGAFTVAPMVAAWVPSWAAFIIMAITGAAFAIGYFKR